VRERRHYEEALLSFVGPVAPSLTKNRFMTDLRRETAANIRRCSACSTVYSWRSCNVRRPAGRTSTRKRAPDLRDSRSRTIDTRGRLTSCRRAKLAEIEAAGGGTGSRLAEAFPLVARERPAMAARSYGYLSPPPLTRGSTRESWRPADILSGDGDGKTTLEERKIGSRGQVD